MDNGLPLDSKILTEAGERDQHGIKQTLCPPENSVRLMTIEPEAEFLQGDSYPERNHFERR